MTVLVVFLVQSDASNNDQDYGNLLVIFGAIMAMASLPIFAIMMCNHWSGEKDGKQGAKTHLPTEEKVVADLETGGANLSSGNLIIKE